VIRHKNVLARTGVIRQFNDKKHRANLHNDNRKINTGQYRTYQGLKYTNNLISGIKKHTKEVRMFVVEKRDAQTLLPIILRNVKKGSQINSDEWRAYSKLNKHGYKHFTVNHSKNFVDPVTKEHTQLIECLWLVAKSTIMKRRRGTCTNNLPGHLAEDWLRSLDKKCPNVFIKILTLLKDFNSSEVVAKCDDLRNKHKHEKINFKNKK
jgi:predicted ABC-class ATPase